MALLDLVQGVGVVVAMKKPLSNALLPGTWYSRSDRDISTIDDRRPAVERVCVKRYIISTTKSNFA